MRWVIAHEQSIKHKDTEGMLSIKPTKPSGNILAIDLSRVLMASPIKSCKFELDVLNELK